MWVFRVETLVVCVKYELYMSCITRIEMKERRMKKYGEEKKERPENAALREKIDNLRTRKRDNF